MKLNGIVTFLLATGLLGGSMVLAQGSGTITGGIYDKQNGDEMIGSSVQIKEIGATAFADVNGKYTFRKVPAGAYTLVAGMDGFSSVTVEGVVVKEGETTTVNFELPLDAFSDAITVTAELQENTEAGLLKHRQKADSISDAISGEAISRAGASSAADAVTKITGASVVGGKYVYIRGLGDRYTSAHLNGVELPTADPDTNAFQADLFPSNILENIVTVKSFTPDKPGNFSGGIVDIGTKSYPDDFTFQVNYSTAYDSQTTFDDNYLYYKGSGSDWMGRDNGLRALPGIVSDPSTQIPDLISARRNEAQANLLSEISKSFEPVMSPSTKSGPLNQGFGVTLGDQRYIGERKFGYIATLTYGRKYSYIPDWQTARWKLTEAVGDAATLVNQSDFVGEEGQDKVTWGGLVNTSYSIADNHELGFNFIYTQSGDSKSAYNVGQWPEQFSSDNAFLESRLLKYTERNLQSYQFRGEHFFPEWRDLSVSWTGSLSSSTLDEPDTRIFTDNYSVRNINGEIRNVYSIAASIYSNPARYFRDMQEDSDNFQADFELPLHVPNGLIGKVKFGMAYNKKEREFNELRFEYASESNTRYDGDPEAFFGLDNVGLLGFDEQTGRYIFGNVIQFSPDTRGGDYDGESELNAFYGMVEIPISKSFKLIAGLRQERFDFLVYNDESQGTLDDDDTLPSLNGIINVGDTMNVRLSYGRTLARPTFREKAPYASFDFIADGIFVGNPDLKRTLIDNFDARWEWFPRPDEVFAMGVFYKEFENPIERAYNIKFGSEFGEKTFLNVDEATVYGVELEARKRFDSVGSDYGFLTLSANVSLIESEVDIPPGELDFILQRDPNADTTRELQGQSPYLVNLGASYDNVSWDLSASLFFNVFGERLDEVGIGGAPNSYEQGRESLDFSFSMKTWGDVNVKFLAKNLLDAPVEIIQTFKGVDYMRAYYETGRSFSLSFSYKP